MAKEVKEEAKEEEKHVPVKPKKRSGGGGEINMFMLIGTIAGTVVLMVVIMSAAFYFFILPQLQGGHGGNDSASLANEKIKERKMEAGKEKSAISELEEEDIIMGDKGVHMLETGKIITNPKNSTKFAVLNLSMEYRVSEKDERFAGGGEGGDIKEDNPIVKKLMAGIKNELYSVVGSLTVEDFYAMGSDSLRGLIKKDLKPIFLKNKLFLREVLITEYLIQ
jgi:hypothetical protein